MNLCGAEGLPFPKGAITVGSARGGNKWRLICMKRANGKARSADALLSMPRIGPSMRLSVGDCICKELLQMKVEKETLS